MIHWGEGGGVSTNRIRGNCTTYDYTRISSRISRNTSRVFCDRWYSPVFVSSVLKLVCNSYHLLFVHTDNRSDLRARLGKATWKKCVTHGQWFRFALVLRADEAGDSLIELGYYHDILGVCISTISFPENLTSKRLRGTWRSALPVCFWPTTQMMNISGTVIRPCVTSVIARIIRNKRKLRIFFSFSRTITVIIFIAEIHLVPNQNFK